jgi:hypothetical protein
MVKVTIDELVQLKWPARQEDHRSQLVKEIRIQNISGKTQFKFNSPPIPRATSIPIPGKKTAAVKARNAPKAARTAKRVEFLCCSVSSLMLLLNLLHENQQGMQIV